MTTVPKMTTAITENTEKSNAKYGLLLDYEFCTGCHSCEVACRVEHQFPIGQFGIKILEDGPRLVDEAAETYEWRYLAVPTVLCDLCADRVAMGKRPTCVHHCQAAVLSYGTLEELQEEAKRKPQMVIFMPK